MLSGNEEKQSPFDLLCEAANTENHLLFDQVIDDVSIEVLSSRHGVTPVEFVAMQEDIDVAKKAVTFLLEHYASAGNAACGYARVNRTAEFYQIFDEVKTNDSAQLVHVMKKGVRGFAMSNHLQSLADFLTLIHRDYPNRISFVQSDLAYGYAVNGNIVQGKTVVGDARFLYSSKYDEILKSYLSGLVMADNFSEIQNIFDEFESSTNWYKVNDLHKKQLASHLMVDLVSRGVVDIKSSFIKGLRSKYFKAEASYDFLAACTKGNMKTGVPALMYKEYLNEACQLNTHSQSYDIKLYMTLRGAMLMGMASLGDRALLEDFLVNGIIPRCEELIEEQEKFHLWLYLALAYELACGGHNVDADQYFKMACNTLGAFLKFQEIIDFYISSGQVALASWFWAEIKNDVVPRDGRSVDDWLNHLVVSACKNGFHKEIWDTIKTLKLELSTIWSPLANSIGEHGDISTIEWFFNILQENTRVIQPADPQDQRYYALSELISGLILNQDKKLFYVVMTKIRQNFDIQYEDGAQFASSYDEFYIHSLKTMRHAQINMPAFIAVEEMISESMLEQQIVTESQRTQLAYRRDQVRQLDNRFLELKQVAAATQERMRNDHISYSQIVLWAQPVVRTMLSPGAFAKLPPEMLSHILCFLLIKTPASMNDLVEIREMQVHKTGFFKPNRQPEESKMGDLTNSLEPLAKRRKYLPG